MSRKVIKDNVKKLLEEYPAARNNDRILIWLYWSMIDIIVKEGYLAGEHITMDDFINKATNPAQIVRRRAEIQNYEGKYLPTSWEVAKGRKISREKWEKALGYHQEDKNQLRLGGIL